MIMTVTTIDQKRSDLIIDNTKAPTNKAISMTNTIFANFLSYLVSFLISILLDYDITGLSAGYFVAILANPELSWCIDVQTDHEIHY